MGGVKVTGGCVRVVRGGVTVMGRSKRAGRGASLDRKCDSH